MSKNDKESGDAHGVDTWRDGHSVGTNAAFDWCAQQADQLAKKSNTEGGRRAMVYIAKSIRSEICRRYPTKQREKIG